MLLEIELSNGSHDASSQELKKYGVTTVVRVCEATYDATLVVKEGIQVLVSSGRRPFVSIDAPSFGLLNITCCTAERHAGYSALKRRRPETFYQRKF